MSNQSNKTSTWTAPLIIAALSAVGLIWALLSDRLGDWAAWLMLAVPAAVCLWGLWPRR